MIIQKNESQVLTMGSTKNTAVTFDEHSVGKLMTILTTNLYSNPRGSIVREYFCNCVDAMLGVGNTKDPIIIQLDARNIKFIDFGIGLDEQEFENIFCKILKSTKGHSNAAIGSWGLGSKSAFSYTDSFTVQSTKGGTKRIWNLTKDAMNTINAAKIVDTKATKDDKSGTVVTIPIGYSDYDSFRKEAKTQLQYFKQVYYDFDLANDFKIYDYKDFIFNDKFYSEDLGICLGGVRYEIDYKVLNRSKIFSPIGLKFEIGDLDVTPSRENLFWTPRTIKAVKDKIEKVEKWIKKEVEKGQKKHDDFIKFVSENTSKTYIELEGHKIDVTDLVGSNQGSKDLYTGVLMLQNLHEVFTETRYIRTGYGTNSSRLIKGSASQYTFKNNLSQLRFYNKFNRNKMLWLVDSKKIGDNTIFVKVDEEYRDDIAKHISKYGGWVDDVVVPKTARKNYSTSTKDPKDVDEIVVGFGKLYSGNTDGCSFTKENYKVDKIDSIINTTFIGTSNERGILSNAVKLGYPTIMTAKSNLKYFDNNKNVQNIEKMYGSKDYKDLCKKYFETRYVVDNLRHVLSNHKTFDDKFDPQLNQFLTEYVKNLEELKAMDSCQTVRRLLDEAVVEFDFKIPPSLVQKVESFKHLEKVALLTCSTTEYANTLGLLSLSSWRCELHSKEAVEFLLEYHKLYKKCGK